MRVLDAEQMRRADAAASNRLGEITLMRTAGDRLAGAIVSFSRGKRVVAFAGPGNNGGDAFAAFAILDRSYDRTIYSASAPSPSEARRDAQEHARLAGVRVKEFPPDRAAADAAIDGADLVLDALLGTGARPGADAFAHVIESMNAAGVPVLAADIPTGVDATTGAAARSAVRATYTVTLGAPKLGLFLDPARDYVGELWYGDIGLAPDAAAVDGARYSLLGFDEFVRLLPRRAGDADKRRSGTPLIIAGSAQFPGAAVLCARGAARAGAGYVTVAAPAAAAVTLRAHLVEQVVVSWEPGDPETTIEGLLGLSNHVSAVAIGPGLPLGDETGAIVRGFLQRTQLPIVADASALYHLGKHLDILRGKPAVLTPHAGEFARISGGGTIAPGAALPRLRKFVREHQIATLLKGRTTLIDDGSTVHLNTTGTNALATAGTGDVLTGIIATLLSQGLAPVDAARVGAYWHGRAGQAAAKTRAVGVTAGDVADSLAAALAPDAGHGDASGLLRLYGSC